MASPRLRNVSLSHWNVLHNLQPSELNKVGLIMFFGENGESALFQTENLEVYGIGKNSYGILGIGGREDTVIPLKLKRLSGLYISAFAWGYNHCLALTASGIVCAWGVNSYGQLGQGTTSPSPLPIPVTDLPKITQVSAGAGFSLALSQSGDVYGWGYNGSGQCGVSVSDKVLKPVKVSFPEGTVVTAVSCGWYHSMAINAEGKVYCWGWNENGQLGSGRTGGREATPRLVVDQPAKGFVKIATGKYHSLAITEDGEVFIWGSNPGGMLGLPSTSPNISSPVKVPSLPRTLDLLACYCYSISVAETVDGIYVWGDFDSKSSVGPHSLPTKADVQDAFECFRNRFVGPIEVKKRVPSISTKLEVFSEIKVKIESKAVCILQGDLDFPLLDISKILDEKERFAEDVSQQIFNKFLKYIKENELELTDILSFMDILGKKTNEKFNDFKTIVFEECKSLLTSGDSLKFYEEFQRFLKSDQG